MKNLKFVLTSTIIVLFLGISFQSCNKSELDSVVNPTEAVAEKGGLDDLGGGFLN